MTTPTTTDTIIRAQSRFLERRNHNEKTRAHIRLHDELRQSLIEDGLVIVVRKGSVPKGAA